MNVNEAYPSDFIRAVDLKGREWSVNIERVESREMNDGKVKPIVFFVKVAKGLVLNRTNAMTIASYYGPETDGWRGKEIILYPAKVMFQGQMTDSVRIRALVGGNQTRGALSDVGFDDTENPAPKAAANKTSIADDDIPF